MNLIRKMLRLVGLAPFADVGYRSVKVAFRDGRAPSHGSGDYHARWDRIHLAGMSRDHFRNNAIYKGMIRRAAQYIVGPGFQLQVRTSDAEWNREAERIWKEFWRRPEIRQTLSGKGVERMVAQELLLMGDTGVVKTNRGKIQIIEAEQVCGPQIKDDGVKRDAAGAPTAFYVAPYSDAGAPQPAMANPISTDHFLFLVDPERPTSSRGLPPCQAAFSMLQRINDVCDSEALAWNILSRLALSVNREAGDQLGHGESVEDDTKEAQDGDVASRVTMFEGGVIFHGRPGEKVAGIDRNIPGKDFTASLTTFLRLLGLPLGLPLEFIMLDWTKSNYSQCRAILEQAKETFESWQGTLVDFLHRPLYEWVIQAAMDSGALRMNDEWEQADWILPAFPWIDQLKEAEAHGLMIDRGLTTHARVCKSRGEDRDDVVAQLKKETIEAIRIRDEIKKETGVEVPWEPFCGRLAMPAQATPPSEGAGAEADRPGEAEEDEAARAGGRAPRSAEVGTHTRVVRDAQGRALEIFQTKYTRKPKPQIKVTAKDVVLPDDVPMPEKGAV